jgi:hypothetical protein
MHNRTFGFDIHKLSIFSVFFGFGVVRFGALK